MNVAILLLNTTTFGVQGFEDSRGRDAYCIFIGYNEERRRFPTFEAFYS